MIVTEPTQDSVRSTSLAYGNAYAKLADLKDTFEKTKLSISSVEFARMESAIRQLESIVAAKVLEKNQAEEVYAAAHRREQQEQAERQREERRTALLADLESESHQLDELAALSRSIPEKMMQHQQKRSLILAELATLK